MFDHSALYDAYDVLHRMNGDCGFTFAATILAGLSGAMPAI